MALLVCALPSKNSCGGSLLGEPASTGMHVEEVVAVWSSQNRRFPEHAQSCDPAAAADGSSNLGRPAASYRLPAAPWDARSDGKICTYRADSSTSRTVLVHALLMLPTRTALMVRCLFNRAARQAVLQPLCPCLQA
jgi:hypothetical protein